MYVSRRIDLSHGDLLFILVFTVIVTDRAVIMIAIWVGVFFDCIIAIRMVYVMFVFIMPLCFLVYKTNVWWGGCFNGFRCFIFC